MKQLNDMETEFVRLTCLGLTYKEIADRLYRSPRTIDGYRDEVLEKTDSRNMAEAISKLYDHGILKPKDDGRLQTILADPAETGGLLRQR